MERFSTKYLYSIISVAAALTLVGLSAWLVIQGQEIVRYAKEHIKIMVELRTETPEAERAKLKAAIVGMREVIPGSLTYIPKETGMKILEEAFDSGSPAPQAVNPLFDVLTFRVKSRYLTPDHLALIKKKLQTHIYVAGVDYDPNLIGRIEHNVRRISYFAIGGGVMMLFIALVLIYYTIQLVIYGDRDLIYTKEMVGASWAFIRRPYVWRAVLNGLWSGVVAMILVGTIWFALHKNLPENIPIGNFRTFVGILAGLPVLGVLISAPATYLAVNYYLRHTTN